MKRRILVLSFAALGPLMVGSDVLALQADILHLLVNAPQGSTYLYNPSASVGSINFDIYTIESDSGALDVSMWNSLHDQEIDKLGDELDEQWVEFGSADEFFIGEGHLANGSTLDPGESFSLGKPYLPNSEMDLTFSYGVVGASSETQGFVVFVPESATATLAILLLAPFGVRRRRDLV